MKKFIVGFVTGAMIFSTAGAYAATNSKMIEVFYNVANIKINKTSSMPTDPDNKPFVYNGTTFVPLRYISEALNLPVQWDGATSTVNIGEMEKESEVYIGNGIDAMNYQESFSGFASYYNNVKKDASDEGYPSNQQAVDNTGIKYDNFVVFSTGANKTSVIEYPLNAKYKKFKTNLGVIKESKTSKASTIIEVLLDGKSVKTYTLTAGSMPQDIEIDVTNANKITFKFENVGFDSFAFGFFNPYFTK